MDRANELVADDSACNSGRKRVARNVNIYVDIDAEKIHLCIHLRRKATFTMYNCVAISALSAEKRV